MQRTNVLLLFPLVVPAVFVMLVSLLLAVVPTTAALEYHAFCFCAAHLRTYGCTPVRLNLVPPGESMWASAANYAASTTQVATAQKPLLRIVLQSVRNDTQEPVYDLDMNHTVSVSLVQNVLSAVEFTSASVLTVRMRDGLAVFDDLSLLGGTQGDTIQLNFSLDATSAWTTSALLRLYVPAPDPDPSNTIFTPQFVNAPSSYFRERTLAGLPALVLDRPLPRISLQIVDLTGGPVTFMSGAEVSVTASFASDLVAGNITVEHEDTVVVDGSTAEFKGITVSSAGVTVGAPIVLEFHVVSARLQAGPIRTQTFPTDAARLSFADGRMSAITGSTTRFHAEPGIALPRISVQMLDSANNPSNRSYDRIFIVAACVTAELDPDGTREATTAGIAHFDRLRFVGRRGNDTRPAEIVFTVDGAPNLLVASAILRSPPLWVLPDPPTAMERTQPRYLRFVEDPARSWLSYTGQSRLIVAGTQPPRPILVELVNANGQRSTTATGFTVVVSSSDARVFTASVVRQSVSVRGLATFDALEFSAPLDENGLGEADTPLVLSFAILGTSDIDSVSSGTVRVVQPAVGRGVPTSLRFSIDPASSLFTSELQAGFGTAGVTLPPIVVELVDVEDHLVTSVEDAVIAVDCGGVCPNLIGGSAVTSRGRAVFSHLTFTAGTDTRLRFYVVPTTAFVATASNGEVLDKSLYTGRVTIEPELVDRFALRFLPGAGHVRTSGAEMPAIADEVVPPFGVQLVTSTHIAEPLSLAAGSTVVLEALLRYDAVPPETASARLVRVGPAVNLDAASAQAWFRDVVLPAVDVPVSLCVRVAESASAAAIRAAALPALVLQPEGVCSGNVRFLPRGSVLGLTLVEEPLAAAAEDNTTTAAPFAADAPTATQLFAGTAVPYVFESRDDPFMLEVEAVSASTSVSELEAAAGTDRTVTPIGDGAAIGLAPAQLARSESEASAPFRATIGPFNFSAGRYVEGHTYSLAVSTPLLAAIPLSVGPFVDATLRNDVALPVIVAEVLQDYRTFSWRMWRQRLLDVMNLDTNRVQLVRARPGGSAVADAQFLWSGTRVEFRFSAPTTAARNKESPNELTSLFLSLDETTCIGLRLRTTYLKQDDSTCDLYRLDEQLTASRRCVSTSSSAERCSCFIPLFEAVGPSCELVTQMQLTCAQLSTCPQDLISSTCSAFRNQLYLQYLKIFGYGMAGVAFLLLVYGYTNGFFERLKRTKMGSTGNRKKKTMTSGAERATAEQKILEPAGLDDLL